MLYPIHNLFRIYLDISVFWAVKPERTGQGKNHELELRSWRNYYVHWRQYY